MRKNSWKFSRKTILHTIINHAQLSRCNMRVKNNTSQIDNTFWSPMIPSSVLVKVLWLKGHHRVPEMYQFASVEADFLLPSSEEDYVDNSLANDTLRDKNGYRHVPHSEKSPQIVAKRNARERKRVQGVNNAFVKLRSVVPIQNTRYVRCLIKKLHFVLTSFKGEANQ